MNGYSLGLISLGDQAVRYFLETDKISRNRGSAIESAGAWVGDRRWLLNGGPSRTPTFSCGDHLARLYPLQLSSFRKQWFAFLLNVSAEADQNWSKALYGVLPESRNHWSRKQR
jgi:hypothetical protein